MLFYDSTHREGKSQRENSFLIVENDSLSLKIMNNFIIAQDVIALEISIHLIECR